MYELDEVALSDVKKIFLALIVQTVRDLNEFSHLDPANKSAPEAAQSAYGFMYIDSYSLLIDELELTLDDILQTLNVSNKPGTLQTLRDYVSDSVQSPYF